MKIVLIGEKLQIRTFAGANKALPVLASSLYNSGFQEVVQLDLENPNHQLEEILRETEDADLVGISGLSIQLDDIDKHTKIIHKNLRDKKTPIIVGGYAAKAVKEVVLASPHITAFFNGEGEKGIVQIAQSIEKGTFDKDKSGISGLCYVDSNKAYHESVAKRVTTLDTDQNFGFQHIPQIHNMNIFKDENGKQMKTAQLFTQRGCAFRCGYCNKSTEGNSVVFVSSKHLEEQIKLLVEHGFEAVYIDDDTATINQKIFRNNLEMIASYGLKIGINTRIDIEAERIRQADSDIRFAKKHGVVYEFFGVEHTDPMVLMAVEKFNGNSEKKSMQYAKDVKIVYDEMERCGLTSSYFLILGLPRLNGTAYRSTTLDEDNEAIRFALEECNPNYLNLNILRFMPGSAAADRVGTDNPFYCVRPTGEKPITGAYFLNRLNPKKQEYHPIYRCFESLIPEQPRSTAVTPERAYNTLKYAIDLINERIEKGKKSTQLFIDRDVLNKGFISKDSNNKYSIVPFNQF